MGMEIRSLDPADWEFVRGIFLDGVATGQGTFETAAPTWQQWNDAHLPAPRLAAVANGKVLGWAALSPISARLVYAGVAEVSVYVSSEARGQGVGTELLTTLVKESEKNGIWALQASIFPENVASVSLHKLCGFREVGTRRRIGQLKGIWRD
ncbi:MAG: GNAT family N-acetyltransferase, partial [Pyrinomonadaceae bacterium]